MKKYTSVMISSLTMAIAGVASAAPMQTNAMQLSDNVANPSVLDISALNLAALAKHVDVDTADGHWHYDPAAASVLARVDVGDGSFSFDV